jgi:hypothetical protein
MVLSPSWEATQEFPSINAYYSQTQQMYQSGILTMSSLHYHHLSHFLCHWLTFVVPLPIFREAAVCRLQGHLLLHYYRAHYKQSYLLDAEMLLTTRLLSCHVFNHIFPSPLDKLWHKQSLSCYLLTAGCQYNDGLDCDRTITQTFFEAFWNANSVWKHKLMFKPQRPHYNIFGLWVLVLLAHSNSAMLSFFFVCSVGCFF